MTTPISQEARHAARKEASWPDTKEPFEIGFHVQSLLNSAVAGKDEELTAGKEAFDRIRALVGATDSDPMPCEVYVQRAIDTLKAELAKLREERDEAKRIVKAQSGENRVLHEDVEALFRERDALRTRAEEAERGVEIYATAARVIALHLREFVDESLSYDQMIADAARKAGAKITTLLATNLALRDALVKIVNRIGIAATPCEDDVLNIIGEVLASPSPGQPMLDAVEKAAVALEQAQKFLQGTLLINALAALAQYRKQK